MIITQYTGFVALKDMFSQRSSIFYAMSAPQTAVYKIECIFCSGCFSMVSLLQLTSWVKEVIKTNLPDTKPKVDQLLPLKAKKHAYYWWSCKLEYN